MDARRTKTLVLSILIAALIGSLLTATFFLWWLKGNKTTPSLLLSQVTNGSAVVLKQFNAIDNLQGFVIQGTHTNTPSLVYVDKQGRYLIFGTIIDAQGQNVSEQNFQQYIAPQSANIAFNYIGNASWIQQGSAHAPHQLYVIFDPNCIYCHRLYDELQPFIRNGTLAVRWIPVAFLKDSSKGRSYALLASKDPVSSLAQNEINFKEASEEGGIPPLNDPPATVKQQLQNNMAFLSEAQINATPALLYKTQSGLMKLEIGMVDTPHLKSLITTLGSSF